jgi:hypothetical protein
MDPLGAPPAVSEVSDAEMVIDPAAGWMNNGTVAVRVMDPLAVPVTPPTLGMRVHLAKKFHRSGPPKSQEASSPAIYGSLGRLPAIVIIP